MYSFNEHNLSGVLSEILQANLSPETWAWLQEMTTNDKVRAFNLAFAALPRKTGKGIIQLQSEQENKIKRLRTDFVVNNWTLDRLSRVWLLLQLKANDKADYISRMETLFTTAEMNELVALYSSLPLLAYPEAWIKRCAEGIRSNIGSVLEAMICDNPYPAENLDESAWNQLVLKAFFTEKPVNRIIGLDSRANKKLALTLIDFAHERWAAKRSVPPQLWRMVYPFLDELTFPAIQRLAASENIVDRKAAALACSETSYPPARELLAINKELTSWIKDGALQWETL